MSNQLKPGDVKFGAFLASFCDLVFEGYFQDQHGTIWSVWSGSPDELHEYVRMESIMGDVYHFKDRQSHLCQKVRKSFPEPYRH